MLEPIERLRTLCLLLDRKPPERLLLGIKKAGFGAGKITGFGGKVEPGEALQQAARREMLEESGVRVSEESLAWVGTLRFLFPWRPEWSQTVEVFVASAWRGDPTESQEMRPAWFPLDTLPFDQMWQDAQYWLPPILEGKRIRAEFVFRPDNESILSADVSELDNG